MRPEVSESNPAGEDKSVKPDIVGWDGSEDVANPRNWTKGRKNMHVLIISVFTLYS